MCKPDAVQRGLVGDIICRFEKRGYKLVAMKLMNVSKELAEAHYADLSARPFFPDLVKFITSSPVVAMCWQGLDVVKQGRYGCRRRFGDAFVAAIWPGIGA
jgi:nucleoside-diphosphate kinase